MKSPFKLFASAVLPLIEQDLKEFFSNLDTAPYHEFHQMIAHHMGWNNDPSYKSNKGKRLRPLLLLLVHQAAGGNFKDVIPLASAVEILHNFSLIHDDIEDNSKERRGRPAVWAIWGIPQAINIGDAMFTMATISMLRLKDTIPPQILVQAINVFHQACLHLTQGQFLDINFESQDSISIENYLHMIGGKTAALIKACCEIGAITANVPDKIATLYSEYGFNLGLAFQMIDDYLGIWGDPAKTGKSVASDLINRKKTLPILYGLSHSDIFTEKWNSIQIDEKNVTELADLLKDLGAQKYTLDLAKNYTEQALLALERAQPDLSHKEALLELTEDLLARVN